MDLYKQAVHLLDGEEIHHEKHRGADGVREVEYKTWGTERWIRRARNRGVLTGLELLAVILFVVEDFTDASRDGRIMVNQWANAINETVSGGGIVARDPHSYLPLKGKPDNWDWVVPLDAADAFVALLGMKWTCSQIVEHLYNETFPDEVERGNETHGEHEPAAYTTKDLDLVSAAIKEFWERHDSDAPPKKETVVEWLTQRGMSKGLAEAADTLMRSEKARKGGNKRLASSN